ncbi:MAG: hypothetical protein JNG86_08005 [Verrucomicrobiaceae bacterium]|nr:hypothetical protein [Verrucomicrobiaceae bacterium]
MTLIQGIYQRLLVLLPAAVLLTAAGFEEVKVGVQIAEKSLLLLSQQNIDAESIQVFAKDGEQPLFGEVQKLLDTHPGFIPAVPFVRGQTYRVEFRLVKGGKAKLEVTFEAQRAAAPTVRLSPATSLIPANTLKLYLDFSEPMEQGVFLKHLTLQRRDGDEVAGPFRETELWSPDGKRLTVMLHPGRQKTGVNLNVDEGPVLIAGERYNLIVSGQWRSTTGVPLGKEGVFRLEPVAVDHEMPDPAKWQVHAPKAGTTHPLVVVTEELFEPQIFTRALRVVNASGMADTKVVDLKRVEWRFTPEQPWKAGEHQITIDPELEDLAGNNLLKPMEVDLAAEPPKVRPNVITFRIEKP